MKVDKLQKDDVEYIIEYFVSRGFEVTRPYASRPILNIWLKKINVLSLGWEAKIGWKAYVRIPNIHLKEHLKFLEDLVTTNTEDILKEEEAWADVKTRRSENALQKFKDIITMYFMKVGGYLYDKK
jgi:hypothetical protein